MTFSFSKKSTINNLKDWIVEQINSNCVVDDYYNNYDNKKINILEYIIRENKTYMADYLINLGMEYNHSTILTSDDIEFIKKHVHITKFSTSPNTKLSDLSVDDLMTLRTKGVNI